MKAADLPNRSALRLLTSVGLQNGTLPESIPAPKPCWKEVPSGNRRPQRTGVCASPRLDCAAQPGIRVLACHAVILSAAERSEESRSGLVCRETAGRDACPARRDRHHSERALSKTPALPAPHADASPSLTEHVPQRGCTCRPRLTCGRLGAVGKYEELHLRIL